MTSTPWTFAAESPRVGADGNLSLVDGDTFVVSSANGDIRLDHAEGLFMLDTRVLSAWLVEVDGFPLDAVSAISRGPFAMTIVARPRHLHDQDPTLAVLRHRHIDRGLRETIELRNYSTEPVDVEVCVVFDADFAGLFDVKAGRYDIGTPADHIVGPDSVELVPAQVGNVRVSTRVSFDPRPHHRTTPDRAVWRLQLAPGEVRILSSEVNVEIDGTRIRNVAGSGESLVDSPQIHRLERWQSSVVQFECDDSRLERAAGRALDDLAVLRIFDPEHADRVVVAAGAPWFMALFGRDSILAAWMALFADHQLAAGVLQALADGQGRDEVSATEEQPGRILHEVRYDHQSTRLLGGSNVYYGSVDATPLFVMLVAEYLRWTNDIALVESLLPAVDNALAWMRDYGDIDGDGFIEYSSTRQSGLANQGWKDSWDGVRYGDGRVATAPIALCEVQAYAYAAYEARAYLADVTGDHDTTRLFRERAGHLKEAFDDAFWLETRGTYAIGLDSDKRPIDSNTSNVGHCLWAGIVPAERSPRIVETLTSPELFSGWGLRTLSNANPAYNPLSYHCGSVWPHDTAIAIAGVHRYGHHDHAKMLRNGLLDAADALGAQLPELFSGFARSDLPSPIPYPASCSPQAWAATSPMLLIRSMLGFEPDLPRRRVRIREILDDGPRHFRARGVPLGPARIEIAADSGRTDIRGLPPDISVDSY
jgi:glycogen debranching enzyme